MDELRRVGTLIVGAGFAGLGMAIRLKQSGDDDFLVVERGADVGGTWRDNTYPGCMCDVPSSLYSFSFAQKPDWTTTYPRQPEIWEYLRRCADDFGVRRHICFEEEMLEASWDAGAARWRVRTSRGAVEARFLVLGAGALSEPSIPALPGVEAFSGAVFHSARWQHDVDLRGKRVAVVGTGASAVQIIPEIQPLVRRLHVLQRTPAWVLPHPGRRLSRLEQRLGAALPAYLQLRRAAVYAGRELMVVGLTVEPRLMRAAELLAVQHLRRHVADPVLRRALTPRFRLGCKRILISNEYYSALSQPNVEVIAHGVSELRERTIVAGDGTEREVDVVVFATGFHVAEFPIASRVRNGDQVLGEVWRGSPEAYAGTTVAGFPNLFVMTGPNTGLGHTSMVYVIESQIRYVLRCMEAVRSGGFDVLEVRDDAQRSFNDRVQRRMRRTVWLTGGCSSWYLDAQGRNTTLWPSFTFAYRRRLNRFDAPAYTLRRGTLAA